MELDRRSADRDVLLEAGSAILEGIAAIAIVFILFTVMAQVATALIAHRTAQGAVAAAASETALGTPAGEARDRLASDIASTVPGAADIEVSVWRGTRLARAEARFRFIPPGPLLRGLDMEVAADAPLVVAP